MSIVLWIVGVGVVVGMALFVHYIAVPLENHRIENLDKYKDNRP